MIAKYLEELLKQKEQLANNLRIKGIEADSSETLNTLIPKVLQIQGGSPKRQPVFVAEEVPEKYADTIYTIFQNGIQDLSGYIRNNKPFCNKSNGYILNYSQADFGWDGFVCTGSTTPINVDSQTAITMCYQSGCTERGGMFLVPTADKDEWDTIQNYVYTSLANKNYVDVPFYWLQCDTFITSLGLCDAVTPGQYYLCWLGRSNNTHPLIKKVEIMN